jgi:hypothetical protein
VSKFREERTEAKVLNQAYLSPCSERLSNHKGGVRATMAPMNFLLLVALFCSRGANGRQTTTAVHSFKPDDRSEEVSCVSLLAKLFDLFMILFGLGDFQKNIALYYLCSVL